MYLYCLSNSDNFPFLISFLINEVNEDYVELNMHVELRRHKRYAAFGWGNLLANGYLEGHMKGMNI